MKGVRRMKIKLPVVIVMAGLAACSAMATQTAMPSTPAAPDKAKLSYAVGLRMGMQLMSSGTNVDENVAMHAIEDVLAGRPTMMPETEVALILNHARSGMESEPDKQKFSYAGGMREALLFKHSGAAVDPAVVVQAMEDLMQGQPKMKRSEIGPIFIAEAKYQAAAKKRNDENEGPAFLAKNAKNPGIKVLPDGLQYQIIQPGTGPLAKPSDLIFLQYRGTFVNGVVFDQHPHFLTRVTGGVKGWQDVLPQMPVGSEWRIFVPSNLAFGARGESFHGVGPDATVIYDLKMLAIAPPGGNYEVSSGMGHGLDIGTTTTDSNSTQ
jgi:FKBP-type peptidyl-prolyl cis-trans isomerase